MPVTLGVGATAGNDTPGGRDDPELTLLEFTPNQGEVWASTDSSAVFAWEVAKALVSGSEPDVGVIAKIDF